jgi:hypothetical protein
MTLITKKAGMKEAGKISNVEADLEMYLITGWPSVGATCVSPAVFLAFGAGETPAPERSEGERGGGRNPLPQRPYKTTIASGWARDGHPVIKYLEMALFAKLVKEITKGPDCQAVLDEVAKIV